MAGLENADTLHDHEDPLLAADVKKIAAASPDSAVMRDNAAEVASFLAKAGLAQHLPTLRKKKRPHHEEPGRPA